MGGARPVTLALALASAYLLGFRAIAAPTAVASANAVEIGETFSVRVTDAPPGTRARWRVNTRAKFLRADSLRNEAKFEAIANGEAIVTATLDSQEIFATVNVGPETKAVADASPPSAPTPPAVATAPAPTPVPASIEETDSRLSLDALLERETARERQLAENPNPDGDRSMASLRAEIAERFARNGDAARAVEYLGSSLFLDAGHPDRWEKLGDLAELVIEPALASTTQTAYENALLLDPNREDARVKLIGSYLGSRNFDDALPHLEYLASGGDEHPPDWLHVALLATAYIASGRIDAGKQFFSDRAMETGDSKFAIASAMLEHASGDTPLACQLLAQVARSEPPDSAVASYAVKLREMLDVSPPGHAQ